MEKLKAKLAYLKIFNLPLILNFFLIKNQNLDRFFELYLLWGIGKTSKIELS